MLAGIRIGDFFAPPSGIGASFGASAEADVSAIAPVAMKATTLLVRVADASGPVDRRFTLRVNGADTTLSCVVAADSFPASCAIGGESVAINEGVSIALRGTNLGGPGVATVNFGWRAETP